MARAGAGTAVRPWVPLQGDPVITWMHLSHRSCILFVLRHFVATTQHVTAGLQLSRFHQGYARSQRTGNRFQCVICLLRESSITEWGKHHSNRIKHLKNKQQQQNCFAVSRPWESETKDNEKQERSSFHFWSHNPNITREQKSKEPKVSKSTKSSPNASQEMH